ncbi:hypothetical protein DL98DRAFT_394629, partial [Cadophora sp. DSE1049]
YDLYTTTAPIPFSESLDLLTPPMTNKPHVRVRISSTTSRLFTPVVDTGTCGFAVSAADLPDWDPAEATPASEGWQFLSSSDKLYVGHWVERDLYFNVRIPTLPMLPIVRSRVKVLAVTSVTTCSEYNVAVDRDVCPMSPLPQVTPMPSGIELMGIGFGRMADGQPQGTPDKNPFLNIADIIGGRLNLFYPGYIIRSTGIDVGLTIFNMFDMRFAHLPARSGKRHPYDWGELPACVSVGGSSPCMQGTALLDTGIDYANIRTQANFRTWPTHADPASTHHKLVNDHVNVRIELGQPGVEVEEFEVGVDIRRGVTPSEVRVYRDSTRAPFVNTGRHIYRDWDVAFDPVAGVLG